MRMKCWKYLYFLFGIAAIMIFDHLSPAFPAPAGEPVEGMTYHPAYYKVEHLNPGLPAPREPVNLSTPQALLEHFILSGRKKRFHTAAHGLDLNLFPEDRQGRDAAALAENLAYVLEQKVSIPWDDLPDRPDGQITSTAASDAEKELAGEPRRSILLTSIDADGRSLPIRIQRVKPADGDPVWVFSASTVENIPLLYEKFGPGFVDRYLPAWMRVRAMGSIFVWEWLYLVGLFLLSLLAGWLVQKAIVFSIKRSEKDWTYGFASILPGPLSLLAALSLFYLLKLSLLSFTGPILSVINPMVLAFIVFAFTWLGTRIIKFISDYISRKYVDELQYYGNERSRHLLTVIDVGRRVMIVFALLIGLGLALSQLNLFKVVGISLLASAGVVSVIIGVAAQSLLGNLLGGVQIAVTKPVSIGDNVEFEGHWGYVEHIAYTHVTIRTWDHRRLVVPLRYFLNHPVENWSMTDPHLIWPIYLYVDYRTDVEQIRKKFDQLLRASEEWDERTEPLVQVTKLTERTMEVRALCSSGNPSTAWALSCKLREEMVRYVRQLEDGRYLPTRRLEVDEMPDLRVEGASGSGGSSTETSA